MRLNALEVCVDSILEAEPGFNPGRRAGVHSTIQYTHWFLPQTQATVTVVTLTTRF